MPLLPVVARNTAAIALPLPRDGFAAFLRAIRGRPILAAEQETELALRLREQGDIEAARQLALANLGFVVRVARGYSGYGLPLPDLVQEGVVGLLKAIKRFDSAAGVRLISYAVHWIRAEIHEYVLRNWRIVRRATTKLQRKLFFKKQQLGAPRSGNMQHEQDLADSLGVSRAQVDTMRIRLHGSDLSLDLPPGVGGQHVHEPADLQDPLSLLEQHEEERDRIPELLQAVATLDTRSRDIVQRRWLCETPAGLAELADQYGVSAERIRQIQERALGLLRKALVHQAPEAGQASMDAGPAAGRRETSGRAGLQRSSAPISWI
ncbi:MAG TPA: RNA polymerase factor sigma-32 [Solimonas sp.]|nr:RNA polymerase factor sigma-32 [Solimonas sp.]